MRKGRIIVVLPSDKLILSVDGGKFTSGGVFLTKSNQFITKNFWIELLVVTSQYNYLILALWAELLSALRANSNSTIELVVVTSWYNYLILAL